MPRKVLFCPFALPPSVAEIVAEIVAEMLQAIKYSKGSLEILDQLQLPFSQNYIPIRSTEDAWHAIRDMKVRGAPAIAIVAMLALASELTSAMDSLTLPQTSEDVHQYISNKLAYLVTSRPTAVNLSDAARKLERGVSNCVAQLAGSHGEEVANTFIRAAEAMLKTDLEDNERIGHNGAEWIAKHATKPGHQVAVLTHCNTGSLATSGYGTALGVIRSLFEKKNLRHAYCTETRPYNQGSRLTAFELVHDEIPATLITDSMAAALLADTDVGVGAIVVGADRVAANGDTANKIGTYALAVLAKHHGVKFLVAAPRTTIDLDTKSGQDIIIEQRPAGEVTKIKVPRGNAGDNGGVSIETIQIAAPGIHVWNPAFDVTPSALIDGIVTEVGVVEKGPDGQYHLGGLFDESST